MGASVTRTPPTRRRALRTGIRLVLGLAILVVFGTAALLTPGMATEPLSLADAAFTATSALAVTGLSVITPYQDLTLAGQIALLLMIEIGGVGFMTGAVVVLRLLGRKVYLADRLALRDSFGLVEPRAILRIMWQVLLTTLVIQAVAAVFFWFDWRSELGAARAVFYAFFHAASAFCNAGFDLFSGSPYFGGAFPTDTTSLAAAGTLIILGGLGIPVLADLLTWPRRRRRLMLHTRVTLVVYAALILLGALGFLLAETRAGGTLTTTPFGRSVELTVFQSISARTAGIAALPSFENLTPASQWVMMALMLVGCAPASMGGGITTGTLAVLALSFWAYVKGYPAAVVGGRTIGWEAVRRAAAILTISLLVVAVATWLILMTHPVGLDQALFEVISAFATCGLSLAFTSQLNPFGLLVIMTVMFWGRLGALTIVVALAQTAPPQAVVYPEETLLIG
ncbi:MAG: potassium transporter [Anaerolineae bacterium]|jgi:trk system potassium uptake protein TrkH|nr:potassium transporter [Anaerolineae bacterium]